MLAGQPAFDAGPGVRRKYRFARAKATSQDPVQGGTHKRSTRREDAITQLRQAGIFRLDRQSAVRCSARLHEAERARFPPAADGTTQQLFFEPSAYRDPSMRKMRADDELSILRIVVSASCR